MTGINSLLVFALLFVAIAIGWYLGRRGGAFLAGPTVDLPSQYYQGLNYLLDGQPDGAIDAFINALDVNSETLETHIALGKLLRKRGEVDRAIRIHQNLLARPRLPTAQLHQAHLELARDYISAGLLDRAEQLLLDLIEEAPELSRAARRHLVEIYQSERDWRQAIAVASTLIPRKSIMASESTPVPEPEPGQPVSLLLAHYHCELAAEEVSHGTADQARSHLQDALAQDRQCVRAALMLGEVECSVGHYRQAIAALRQVRQQDSAYLPETIPTLRECYGQLGDSPALRSYLLDCLETNPSPQLMLAVAEDLRQTDGNAAASEFLSTQLAQRPSLRGLAHLIGVQMDESEGKVRDNLRLLQLLVDRLIVERPAYRCGHCGFAGRELHWFCPGCKHWGTVKSIRGSRAD